MAPGRSAAGGQEEPKEPGLRIPLDDPCQVAAELAPADAIDLMATQAVRSREFGSLVEARVEACRPERRVGGRHEAHIRYLVRPVPGAFGQQRGVGDVVPDQVVGPERDIGLVLRDVVDRERCAVRPREDDECALPVEAGRVDERDVPVDRAELDRLRTALPVPAEEGARSHRRPGTRHTRPRRARPPRRDAVRRPIRPRRELPSMPRSRSPEGALQGASRKRADRLPLRQVWGPSTCRRGIRWQIRAVVAGSPGLPHPGRTGPRYPPHPQTLVRAAPPCQRRGSAPPRRGRGERLGESLLERDTPMTLRQRPGQPGSEGRPWIIPGDAGVITAAYRRAAVPRRRGVTRGPSRDDRACGHVRDGRTGSGDDISKPRTNWRG